MKKNRMAKSLLVTGVAAVMVAGGSTPASAEWRNNVGTGFAFMNISGDQGWQTPDLPIVGSQSVVVPLALNPDDIQDMMESGIGFGGASTDGTWLIQYAFSSLELEQSFRSAPGPVTGSRLSGSSNFTVSGLEVTAGYLVYDTQAVKVFADGGFRQTKQEFDNQLTSTGAIEFETRNKFDESWVDALVGVTVNVPLSKQLVWASRANIGTGGTDETYFVSTGLNWKFDENWAAGLTAKYAKVDYENGDKGDSDWYLYNAEESVIGLNVLYGW